MMEDNLNLEIKNYGPINNANIELKKINVIGGVNGSGKSTISKVLYCFLRANSYSRDKFIIKKILPDINEIINISENPELSYSIIDYLMDKDQKNIKNKLKYEPDLLKIYEEYKKSINNDFSKENISKVRGKSNIETNFEKFSVNDNILDILKEYNKARNKYELDFYDSHQKDSIQRVDLLSELIKDYHPLGFILLVELLFASESLSYDDFIHKNDFILKIFNESFECDMTPTVELKYGLPFYFYTSGHLEKFPDVFYVDTISLLDLYNDFLLEHNKHIMESMRKSHSNEKYDKKTLEIINKINNIIKGEFSTKHIVDEVDLVYLNLDSDVKLVDSHISSGFKQIGIMQLLLANNQLKPGSFLIIDEPESNLHPEWQFKLAEILVLLAKELDINIYINSHSPAFIESIDAFTEYYDMEDDVNYYLTEESEIKGKYNFTKIDSNELSKLYDNLGNLYFLIDHVRLQKRLGE